MVGIYPHDIVGKLQWLRVLLDTEWYVTRADAYLRLESWQDIKVFMSWWWGLRIRDMNYIAVNQEGVIDLTMRVYREGGKFWAWNPEAEEK